MKSIAYHLLDIVHNSLRAGARLVKIDMEENTADNWMQLSVKDDGKGMAEEDLHRAVDPYYTSRKSRNIGLGLPLLKQNAERTGGSFHMGSEPGVGTLVCARFVRDHLDLPPMGDLPGTLHQMIIGNPGRDFVYRYVLDGASFKVDTREIREILEDWPLDHPKISGYLRELIQEYFSQIESGSGDSVVKHT
ncbi:MAG TPA: ATP-binding protein [Bacteroidales bacterium]|nr:ATP-binding protein [Bacteroidales bacterium]